MSQQECNRKSELMQEVLGKAATDLSRTTGFVQRASKMDGQVFAQTLVMGWLANPEATLNELVQYSAELGVSISEAGLHQRFNEQAVEFLKQLVAYAVRTLREESRLPDNVLEHFSSVNILDSSIITLPETLKEVFAGYGTRGGQSSMKLQLSFDYLSGQLNTVKVVPGREPDQNCELHTDLATPNSLHLFDLGYFKQSVFAELAQAQAYFVSRLQVQTALYKHPDDQHSLDLVKALQLQSQSKGELAVYLGRLARVPIRLVFQKLPADMVAEKRRKAKANARKRGQTCSKRHLALLEWVLFITNVPAQWLTAEQVLMVYRIRWQVELVFKLWKSQSRLDQISGYSYRRVMCQFYGRLLAIILFQWTIAPYRFYWRGELSPTKAFHVMRRYALSFLPLMADRWRSVPAVLEQMIGDFSRYALRNPRKKSPSTYQSLLLVGA